MKYAVFSVILLYVAIISCILRVRHPEMTETQLSFALPRALIWTDIDQ